MRHHIPELGGIYVVWHTTLLRSDLWEVKDWPALLDKPQIAPGISKEMRQLRLGRELACARSESAFLQTHWSKGKPKLAQQVW